MEKQNRLILGSESVASVLDKMTHHSEEQYRVFACGGGEGGEGGNDQGNDNTDTDNFGDAGEDGHWV